MSKTTRARTNASKPHKGNGDARRATRPAIEPRIGGGVRRQVVAGVRIIDMEGDGEWEGVVVATSDKQVAYRLDDGWLQLTDWSNVAICPARDASARGEVYDPKLADWSLRRYGTVSHVLDGTLNAPETHIATIVMHPTLGDDNRERIEQLIIAGPVLWRVLRAVAPYCAASRDGLREFAQAVDALTYADPSGTWPYPMLPASDDEEDDLIKNGNAAVMKRVGTGKAVAHA